MLTDILLLLCLGTFAVLIYEDRKLHRVMYRTQELVDEMLRRLDAMERNPYGEDYDEDTP
jgi:hypothetical protein